MLKAENVLKRFESKTALESFNATIEPGSIYGLIGSNGSGKSTLLRLFSGVYMPDGGSVTLDERPIFESPEVKGRVFFVSDDFFFLPQSTLFETAAFLRTVYKSWSDERYNRVSELFPLDKRARLSSFSKGMRRQAAIILALSCTPDYLLLDEAFDGIDPVIRIALRKVLADDVAARGMAVIISSHNLRELEDMCDHVGLLHGGHILLEKDLDELKLGFCRIQAVFEGGALPEGLPLALPVMSTEQYGSVFKITVRLPREEALKKLSEFSPVFAEGVPLTLEEVFINEMEAVGYDYNNVIF